MLRSVSVVGLAISCLALAQTSTVTLYLPGFDTQALVGSVVGIVCVVSYPELLV